MKKPRYFFAENLTNYYLSKNVFGNPMPCMSYLNVNFDFESIQKNFLAEKLNTDLEAIIFKEELDELIKLKESIMGKFPCYTTKDFGFFKIDFVKKTIEKIQNC